MSKVLEAEMSRTDYAMSGPLPDPLPSGLPEILAAFWSMNEWEQERFLRFMRRMAANDREVDELVDLLKAGRITRRQFFELV